LYNNGRFDKYIIYLEKTSIGNILEIYLLEQQHQLFIQEIEQWLQTMIDAISSIKKYRRKNKHWKK
jgi:hypothetical protein